MNNYETTKYYAIFSVTTVLYVYIYNPYQTNIWYCQNIKILLHKIPHERGSHDKF